MRRTSLNPQKPKGAAPIVFVPSKDVTLLFCVEFHELIAVTKRELNPIRHLDKHIDSLCKATVFSLLEAKRVYCQIKIGNVDMDKVAVTSNHGLYRFILMPFDLQNASGTFQSSIELVLSSVNLKMACV